jgi:hypothetical protein
MRKLTVFNSVTLDGVMQAPGRPDEDRRGGFAHGGWAVPYSDEVMAKTAAEGMTGPGALLLGRRTYEDFFSFWPHQSGNPFTEVLDNTPKYVASTTLAEPLPWAQLRPPGRRRGRGSGGCHLPAGQGIGGVGGNHAGADRHPEHHPRRRDRRRRGLVRRLG